MVLYVKNMVCRRCIMAVEQILSSMGILFDSVHLGEIHLPDTLMPDTLIELDKTLRDVGFEIIDDRKKQLIEKIKTSIITTIQHGDLSEQSVNFSEILTRELSYDYTYLSNLFSEKEGITIEKFIIAQKIEKIKELLVYNEWSLKEIAHKMGYSSVAYLSNQFKKVTGLTPSYFKSLSDARRRPLDEL